MQGLGILPKHMAKGDRANLERLLRRAWEWQCRNQMVPQKAEAEKNSWKKLFDFIENPFTLGALFLLGGIVGAILFTPAFVTCAFCILLGFHRAGVVADQSRKRQVIAFSALIVVMSVGGYVLYELLDSKVQNLQTEFAKKVASFANPSHPTATNNADIPGPTIAIFAKCDWVSLPLKIPAHSQIRIVPVNEKGMKANSWGSFEVQNNADTPSQWPDKNAMHKAKMQHDIGTVEYKCEVSNHGGVNLLDIAIPMQFTFIKDVGAGETVSFTPIISPLDVGQTFELYFVNDCPTSATGFLPENASVLVVGETKRRNTKLNLPHRNPIDPIMFWFATKSKWVNWTQCE